MSLPTASFCTWQRYAQIFVVLAGHTKWDIFHVREPEDGEFAFFYIHSHVSTQKYLFPLFKKIILQLNWVSKTQFHSQVPSPKMLAMPVLDQTSIIYTYISWPRNFIVCPFISFPGSGKARPIWVSSTLNEWVSKWVKNHLIEVMHWLYIPLLSHPLIVEVTQTHWPWVGKPSHHRVLEISSYVR